ncbi:hypothetical protein MKX03_003977, partial [Papaver bracteatum]
RDRVGVGCLACSCLECEYCKDSQEQYCEKHQFTYNGIFWDGSITYGGYSKMLVVDISNFGTKRQFLFPEGLPMDAAAPLLCAGITVFTPFKDYNLLEGPLKKIGVVGLGGLGHVAVKFGKGFGHHVTVISTSPSKEAEAKVRLGADDFIVSTNTEQMQVFFYLLSVWLALMAERYWGSMHILWLGLYSLMGKNITCDIEVVKTDQINDALDRLARNDVHYRFVIDIAGAKSSM